ncbi:MAG: histidinol-phosphatase HisJ family protein [Clostridiales bacterium]|nr:histidinol-phosphatase HisJ family protein [Clostridiales bacterium]
MIDTHTHTAFSFDGKSSLKEMVLTAKKLNVEYYAITDHCDLDYRHIPEYSSVKQIELEKYIDAVTKIKKKYPFVALGLECGYSKKAIVDYLQIVPFEKFDYILNSTHIVDDKDCYNQPYFKDRTKKESYERYLLTVRESLEVPYPYNALSHLGFVRKNAPFEDKSLRYIDFPEIFDDIFLRMIELDKCLELNAHTKGHGFMPDLDIVKRYRELGGQHLTYASDAHIKTRICENYHLAKEVALIAGFRYWTVYRNQKPIKIKI